MARFSPKTKAFVKHKTFPYIYQKIKQIQAAKIHLQKPLAAQKLSADLSDIDASLGGSGIYCYVSGQAKRRHRK